MAERPASSRWTYQSIFVGIAAMIAFVQLLPLGDGTGGFPGPDVLLLVAIAWVLRRPEFIPVWIVAAVFLATDVLFMRPLGLWAALVVLGTEFLRSRAAMTRDLPFLLEWLMVAGVVTIIGVANLVVLAVFLVDQPPLGLTLIRIISTIAVYPLIVALAARSIGLRKIVSGDVDRLGNRQ